MSKVFTYSRPGNLPTRRKEFTSAAAEVNNLILPESFPDTQFNFDWHRFVILDPKTRKAVETKMGQQQADHAKNSLNEHEVRCGRQAIYEVQPLIRPVFKNA